MIPLASNHNLLQGRVRALRVCALAEQRDFQEVNNHKLRECILHLNEVCRGGSGTSRNGSSHRAAALHYWLQMPIRSVRAWFSAATRSGVPSAVTRPPPLNSTTLDRSRP